MDFVRCIALLGATRDKKEIILNRDSLIECYKKCIWATGDLKYPCLIRCMDKKKEPITNKATEERIKTKDRCGNDSLTPSDR